MAGWMEVGHGGEWRVFWGVLCAVSGWLLQVLSSKCGSKTQVGVDLGGVLAALLAGPAGVAGVLVPAFYLPGLPASSSV